MKRKKIKTGWLEYFNFSARERRGAIFLASLLTIQILVLIILRNYPREIPPPDEKLVQKLLDAEKVSGEMKASAISSIHLLPESALQPFDPNEITDTSKEYPGLTKKQVKTISHYLSRGGKFRYKKDFRKMYCLTEADYNRLQPFVQLPDSFIPFKKEDKKVVSKHIAVDMGTADSIEMLVVRGIGPAYASRIVRYREKLGGFCAKEQLKEVWGITDSVYEILSPSLILKDTLPFRYIHLNSDSFPALASHPYLKWKLASIICKYRKQHPFKSKEDLKLLPLITDENFRKLAAYIRLD